MAYPRRQLPTEDLSFVVAFQKCLCERLNIQPELWSPYHPQTDGQTERLITVMEQYLQCYVNYLKNDYPKWLPLAEFVANNQMSESTKIFPFFANTRSDPRITPDLERPPWGDRDDA